MYLACTTSSPAVPRSPPLGNHARNQAHVALSSMEEVPSHRACASCRSQKVRCMPDDAHPTGDVCQRCARSGRPCVFTPLQKRKQRKRTDTRVAELEKEMRQMRQQLSRKQAHIDQADEAVQLPPRASLRAGALSGQVIHVHSDGSDTGLADAHALDRQHAAPGPVLWPELLPDKPMPAVRDVVDSGIVDMRTARRLLETYKNDFFLKYPLVYVAPSTTADDMRQSKPTLFLAVITAASAKDNPELSAILDQEVLQSYATRSLVQSQKSLELVQALLVSAGMSVLSACTLRHA